MTRGGGRARALAATLALSFASVCIAQSGAGAAWAAGGDGRFGIGRAPTPQEIQGWDIAIGPDGGNLPPGSGTVAQGRALFSAKCVSCHGADGEGKPADRLVGGKGTLASPSPVKSIGSFWPYATTIFDYVRRAMPHDKPQSLSGDEVYALTAFLLNRNGIVGDDARLDAASLVGVKMPNHGGFDRGDDSPDLRVMRCMNDCRK
ncbi:MAG: c-type cytochrome [Lautropia sp.]